VSRATVFAYYPAKEDIVLGEAPLALDSLRTALAEAPADASTIAVVRDWLRTLVGWMEPDIVLQRRLAEEVPAVAAARSRVMRDAVEAIAEAVADEVGPGDRLLARMVAGALGSAIAAAEEEAAQRMSQSGRALGDDEVEALLDAAMAFVEGGIASVRREN
jgi:AcrR family transcriptional regulator